MRPLSVLYLEDDKADVELVDSCLKSEGMQCTLKSVTTRDQFLKALQQDRFDAVLVDYSLPGYDGLSALESATEMRPDVPVIIVSGAIGEERAIECLQKGATDYVLKQRLARLGPALRRALDEAEGRRELKAAEAALRRERDFTANVVKASQAFIVSVGPDGKTLMMNEAMLRALGYSREEVAATDYLATFVPESDRKALSEVFRKLAVAKEPSVDESRLLARDGRQLLVEWHRSPVLKDDGDVDYFVGIGVDLTKRRRAEEALRLSRLAMDCAGDAVHLLDEDTRLAYVNDAMCRALGYTREELLSMTLRDIDPDFLQAMAGVAYGDGVMEPPLEFSRKEILSTKASEVGLEVVRRVSRDTTEALKRKGTQTLETRHRRKDGTSFPVEITVAYFEHDGNPYVLAFARDISERRRAEEARLAQVHFLKSLDQVNRVIQQADDVEQMLWDVAETVRSIYEADRVWLLYPCNPHASSFRVPVECTRPEYPGAYALNREVVSDPESLREMRDALASEDPICFAVGPEEPLPAQTAEQAGFRAMMVMAVYPKTGEPWLFGMHQCSYARVWTEDERRLFQQIGRRIGDALGELLIYRDLRESEKRYRDLVEQMTDVIYTLDRQGIITSVNPALETLLGFAPEEVIGTDFATLLHEDSRPQAQQAFERVIREGEATDTTVMVDRTGGLHYVEFASSAIEQDGRVVGTRGIIRDVTDRKRAEDLIRAQRDLGETLGATSLLDEGLRLGLEAAIRVAQMDCGGVYLVDEFSATLKLARHQGLPQDFVAQVSEFEADSPNPELLRSAEPFYGQPDQLDRPLDELVRREGLRAFGLLPIRHEDRVIGHMGVASHVLDEVPTFCRPALEAIANQTGSAIGRLKAEQALRDSEQRCRALVENSTYGVAIHQDAEIVYVNRAAVEMLGYASPEEVLGRSVLEFVHPAGRAPVTSRIRKILERGEPAPPAEEKFLAKDGRIVDVEVTGTQMTYRGKPAVQAAFADVTERKRAEERLRQMETQLAHVSRVSAMGEMVAGVAHEISQPLYAVMNFAQASAKRLAVGGDLNVEDLREWNDAIVEAAARAGEIIQRLRDFARRAPPKRSRVDANDAIREAVELLAFEARHRGVDVSPDLSESVLRLSVDRVQIQQVIVNLLQNALEALDEGDTDRPKRVTIRSRLSEQSVVISVADNGPGLRQDELKIFDPFVTTKPDGLGIGLAISRAIAEAHDGKLWATSDPDGGATFHLALPVAGGKEVL